MQEISRGKEWNGYRFKKASTRVLVKYVDNKGKEEKVKLILN